MKLGPQVSVSSLSRSLLLVLGVLALLLHATHMPLLLAPHVEAVASVATAIHHEGAFEHEHVDGGTTPCCARDVHWGNASILHSPTGAEHATLCTAEVAADRQPGSAFAAGVSGVIPLATLKRSDPDIAIRAAGPPGLAASRRRALLQIYRI